MHIIKKIAVGLSGGVDSAVTALFLKNKGYDVIGAFMRNWDETEESDTCNINKDATDAMWLCDKLNIPFVEVNFVKEYWSLVFEEMVKEYTNGLTPNPDILCNSLIKFDCFFRHCQQNFNADAIATGHYVRSSYGSFLENYNSNEPVRLLQGVDTAKDQSFFLSRISQTALQRTMFPVGSYTKSQVKKIAAQNAFDRILARKESMGICFIGPQNFRKFISRYVPDKPGIFVDVDSGQKMGEHNGIHHWTVGQKCTINGIKNKYYISLIDAETNNIYVVPDDKHPALHCHSLVLSNDHWIVKKPDALVKDRFYTCKFRFMHGKPLVDCRLVDLPDINLILLDVDDPLHAVAPGQFAVFYDGDECLGNAKISSMGPCDVFLEYRSSHVIAVIVERCGFHQTIEDGCTNYRGAS